MATSALGIISLVLAGLTYLAGMAIYRLVFHRISHIPGPKLAALTYWYQSYWDLWPHEGRFLWKTIDLHEKYGSIIRVGADEVQVNDPEFYHEMYNNHRREKSRIWYWMDGWSPLPEHPASINVSHDLHRIRRNAIAPFFSKRNVLELEPKIKEKVEKLKSRLLERAETGELVDLHFAYAGLTLDVITAYTYGESWGALDRSDLGAGIVKVIRSQMAQQAFGRAFPLFSRVMLSLVMWTRSFTAKQDMDFSNGLSGFFKFVEHMVDKVFQEVSSQHDGKQEQSNHTIFHSILRNDKLPAEEKTRLRISAEANIFTGAGTDTTARPLAIGTYYALSQPAVRARLLEELRTVMPTPDSSIASWDVLARLPYLTAIITESLRLANSNPARLVRIAPDEDLVYKGITIPRGTTFGQSSYLIHTDPAYFPDPHSFDPERWLGPDSERLRRYFVPFAKGTRQCAGMNLAYAELYLTLATILSSVDMEVFETTDYDATMEYEHFIAFYPKNSKGLRVKVLGKMKT